MANTHKPFRELVRPDSNFEFVDKRRTWATVSTLAIIACIAMLFVNKSMRGSYLNWSIDFKGGTEMKLSFSDKEGKPVPMSAADLRKALKDNGKTGFSVSEMSWETRDKNGDRILGPDGSVVLASGMRMRTPEFGAISDEEGGKLIAELEKTFAEQGILKASWSGDRLFVRSKAALDWAKVAEFFKAHNHTLHPWAPRDAEAFTTAGAGTGEYNAEFVIHGLGEQYEEFLSESLGSDIVVKVESADGVGARAGEKLRNDGIKSLFYVVALIMFYLAVRFDIRYAPGAVVALLHDVILVVGVFAVTWQEVSLTTVAALLTVIGYSVNDTVVIFDRIRENVVRLKDKKFARVINISLNETMARTLLTSITLFVVTLMMNILGTGLVRNFAFALNVGVVVGVYSSIFVASPVALAIHNKWFDKPAPSNKSR